MFVALCGLETWTGGKVQGYWSGIQRIWMPLDGNMSDQMSSEGRIQELDLGRMGESRCQGVILRRERKGPQKGPEVLVKEHRQL